MAVLYRIPWHKASDLIFPGLIPEFFFLTI
jgi:hypothetical protein